MSAIPEAGQIVEIRRRYWVVGDVQSSAVPEKSVQPQHLVKLSSIDEDALGEELHVIWELEPGAQVHGKAGLPSITGWDEPERLEAFLDAVQWGAATNADRQNLQAPFRSGVSIEDFQLDPVVRAVDMVRVNLLIADDVGLGKTIEAGLVVQELLVRHRARTVLVVCPASLQVKWQMEMQEKFGLEFRIVDAEYLRRLRRERGIHANPWASFPRLITSMDWAKSGEAFRLFKDVLHGNTSFPRTFDMLIVDEAHNVAPSGSGQYALESQRTRFIRAITPHFEHRLFLSATPHNGYQESFTSLLELLDDQRFAKGVEPDRAQLQRIMVRRLKSDLLDTHGQPIYPKRELLPLEVAYTDEERQAHAWLIEYTKRRTLSVKGTSSEFGTTFVLKLLKKRLFSSPMAFAKTLAQHVETISKPVRRREQNLEKKILHKAIQRAEEEYADDQRFEEALEEVTREASVSSAIVSVEERALLDHLTHWAEGAKEKLDSKAQALIAWCETHLRPGGEWNNERVILFTEYLDTHRWLQGLLAAHHFGGERLMVMHGSLDQEERERVKAAFQAHPSVSPVRILLATDAASEGIDLQNHCHYLIHVEIPWNPNVMEQRNGRIDRHGQKHSSVQVWHPVGVGFQTNNDKPQGSRAPLEADHEYLMRAAMKVNAIRVDLGSVGSVIAAQIEEAMLGKRTYLETGDAERKAERLRRYTKVDTEVRKRVELLHKRLMEARDDAFLTPERVAQAVQVGLELAKQPALIPVLLGDTGKTVYQVPVLSGAWNRAASNLEHPHTRVRRPITFDHDVVKGRDDVVLAHLNHPLAQMALRLLRAEVFALNDKKSLHRVTVRSVPSDKIDTPMVGVKSRLVITGGNHHRLHEELTVSGGELKRDTFARAERLGLFEELELLSKPTKPSDALFEVLQKRFDLHADAILLAVTARSRERLRSLQTTLEARKNQEIVDVQQVLNDLESAITRELEQPEPEQLALFQELEKQQLSRDLEALRFRLARIPAERQQETQAVERRYADLQDRTFPVAVVFYVPERML